MRPLTRRDALRQSGAGFGMAGLASLLAAEPGPWAPREPLWSAKIPSEHARAGQ